MSTGVLDRNAYTIGWICALSVESAAAQVFLDERHQVPTDVSDSNSYVTGRVGKHNVVIAVMPQNEYGTATAATTAKDMVRSFPQVRLGLMVGIGGGAPSQEHDIRLGDVVVSSRGKGIGGVIQFDYGKTIQGQGFKETGHLNQPPTALMTAVAALDAQYDLEGPRLDEKVKSVLEKQRKAFKKKYARPSEDTDRLYRSEFTHPNDLSGGCPTTCGVRANDLVPRSLRGSNDDNPTIHYGLVASSNQVMKDAIKRDELAQRGILCFEMEAAGLMNHFPCLVVRGICDYADTHKNSNWQPYAAMVAAAYAKDLLGLVNVSTVEKEKRLSELIMSVAFMQKEQHKTLRDTRNVVAEIESRQRIKNIKEWLHPADPSDNANHAKDLRYERTGTWFLNSTIFKDWLEGRHRHLCLYGEGGCGKTVLTSTILDFLRDKRSGVILYFFFDFSHVQKRNLNGLLRSLLFQLYSVEGPSAQKLDSMREFYDDGKRSPSTLELSECFQSVLATVEEAVIVVDALDECKEEPKEQERLIKWILQLDSATTLKHVKILTTARPEACFKTWMNEELSDANCVHLDTEAMKNDIESYVKGCLRDRPGYHTRAPDHPIVKRIPERLIEKADGMFRYAACQMDDIVSCLGPEEIEDVLDSLPETIQETYKRSIQRIPPRYFTKAIRLFQFLVMAQSPFDLAAAVDIISVRSDFRTFALADRICLEDIVRLCPNLLSIVDIYSHSSSAGSKRNDAGHSSLKPRRRLLQLAHLSVKEYLLQYKDPAFTFAGTDASAAIVRTCLSYIHGAISQAHLTSEFPFYRRARSMWTEQATAADGSAEAVSEMADHLEKSFGIHSLLEDDMTLSVIDDSNLYASCVHFASYWGLGETIKVLATRGMNVNRQMENQSMMSPMEVAAYMNRVKTVQVLLDLGVSPNTPGDSDHRSALQISCEEEYHEVKRLLARHGADLDRLEGNKETRASPLEIAVKKRDATLVQLLLNEGADVNADCGYYGTAIQSAARLGLDELITILLDHGANVNARGGVYGHALQAAAEAGRLNTLRLLLDHGADINAPTDTTFGGALQAAAGLANAYTAKLLLSRGADINAKGGTGAHALLTAVVEGFGHVVKLLLDNGADINAPGDTKYANALQAAIRLRRIDIVDILLHGGADVDCVGNAYGDIVKMFLHSRPDIKSEVGIYLHALRTAAAGGHESIIKFLMEKAGNANNQSPSLGEVLCAAATGGHQGIIKLLLDKGADANARGGPYGNVLTMACMRELPEATKDLLDKGADANASVAGFGKTLHTFMGKRVSYWNDKSTRILKSLLEAGADIHPHGSPSALKLAINRGHPAPITILLSKGADPNIVFDASNKHFNHSLLIESLFKSQPEIAMELLRYGADPNAKTSRRLPNQTALHLALENSSEGVVRLLLQKGADPNGLSGYPPYTPLQLSVKKSSIKYVRLLLEHGADVAAVGGYSKNLTATKLAVQTGNGEILRTLEQEAIKRKAAKRKRKEAEDESSDRLKQPRS